MGVSSIMITLCLSTQTAPYNSHRRHCTAEREPYSSLSTPVTERSQGSMHREVSMHESRPEHHDIVKQYRKGLTAVVDRCVVYTYPTIGTTVCSEKFYSLLLFWSRLVHADLAMHAIRAALFPALCPCEPLGPVGDMQAVSYGARSRQYSPLLPAYSS